MSPGYFSRITLRGRVLPSLGRSVTSSSLTQLAWLLAWKMLVRFTGPEIDGFRKDAVVELTCFHVFLNVS